jgi:hypothetical protein
MSCDNKKSRKAQNEDDVNKAKDNLDAAAAALAEVTKQEQDENKKHADTEAGFIMFVVSSEALGLVSKCRIPTAAVAQRGLFRILLGSGAAVSKEQQKSLSPMGDWAMGSPVLPTGDLSGNYNDAKPIAFNSGPDITSA